MRERQDTRVIMFMFFLKFNNVFLLFFFGEEQYIASLYFKFIIYIQSLTFRHYLSHQSQKRNELIQIYKTLSPESEDKYFSFNSFKTSKHSARLDFSSLIVSFSWDILAVQS